MIDDANVRRMILSHLPNLDPWRVEMEELDFGDVLGVAVKLDSVMYRYQTETRGKTEEQLALNLAQQIKAALFPDLVKSKSKR